MNALLKNHDKIVSSCLDLCCNDGDELYHKGRVCVEQQRGKGVEDPSLYRRPVQAPQDIADSYVQLIDVAQVFNLILSSALPNAP